jgi:succinate dehydrogenase / fumarate reductase cytochrome b subunit
MFGQVKLSDHNTVQVSPLVQVEALSFMSLMQSLFGSSIGKKLLMAGSGILLLLFLLVHLLGNLQVFSGPEALNHYAHFLHSKPAMVIGARLAMLLLFGIHIWTSIQLTLENRAARPVPYYKEDTLKASLASRTMIWSGLTVALFLVYHLLHLTLRVTGPVDHMTAEGVNVYLNVVASFQNPVIALFYVAAQIGLLFHLLHAFSSAFQTLGLHHKSYTPLLEKLGIGYAVVIAGGNTAIVLAVLFGFVS